LIYDKCLNNGKIFKVKCLNYLKINILKYEMENNKNNANFDEANDEINSALKDSRGLSFHQKRFAFCLSDGACKDNVLEILSEKLVTSVENLDKLDKILDVAFKIENKRNELVYGSIVGDKDLQELINSYLEIKKEIEND